MAGFGGQVDGNQQQLVLLVLITMFHSMYGVFDLHLPSHHKFDKAHIMFGLDDSKSSRSALSDTF